MLEVDTGCAVPTTWGSTDMRWLLQLLEVPSVSPFEGGLPAHTVEAQQVFRAGTLERGFTVRYQGCAPQSFLLGQVVPLPVRTRVAEFPELLASQPCVVVSMGRPAPAARRMVINFHIDTVGPHISPTLHDGVLHGRGAIDDKGPGIAAAVGVAAAFAQAPWLAELIEVQLASVPGEEGGAMGTFGTRWLVENGVVGRLMLFAEPTGGAVLDTCTAAMTPRFRVSGRDSTDDHPAGAHNATIALGFLADLVTRRLGPLADRLGVKLCVAGLQTGRSHNRAYGEGELLLNIAYADPAQARAMEGALHALWVQARDEFAATHPGIAACERLLADWDDVVRLDWLKRDLPVLSNSDPAMRAVLGRAGVEWRDGQADGSAFTCDAIWAGAPDRYVAICGPGSLDANGAHTSDEHVALSELADYAEKIKRLTLAFGEHIQAVKEQYR
jgi:acetylornithine deacetylase